MLYTSYQKAIGNTPLVQLSRFDLPQDVALYAKLELANPGGSVKDRVGLAMIEDAEKRGALKPGGTIIEGTAGNTGIGIAFAAIGRGYKVIFVVPDKFSGEKVALLSALGAEIVRTPRSGGMLLAESRAEELARSIPNSVILGQFRNPANPRSHYETTGPEIFDDLKGKVDVFIAGAGSGGTFSGVARYLKEKNPYVRAILADPIGSTMGGGPHGDYNIEGIGNDFIAETMDMSLVDEVIKVSDDEAFSACKELAKREGVIAGSSSGAAFVAAQKAIKKGIRGNIVVLFPDRGDRYFSKGLFTV
ncbi:cysteine synthase family protein [bacterium]|jgi:Cysteine synthase|nr:cysteine synthase family protein [bacterium]MBO7542892.1 cysteine synthase family protein [bacterium]MBP5627102.1 cysteine synthase family protein [bacterium]MBR4465822.1 cysteine synthase family protein [bacterium]